MSRKASTHLVRENKILELVLSNLDREISCVSLFEDLNKVLGNRYKLNNSKQLGFYLKKIMYSQKDLVFEKKVIFVSPSTTLVKYYFKRVDLDEPDEVLLQDLLDEAEGEGSS